LSRDGTLEDYLARKATVFECLAAFPFSTLGRVHRYPVGSPRCQGIGLPQSVPSVACGQPCEFRCCPAAEALVTGYALTCLVDYCVLLRARCTSYLGSCSVTRIFRLPIFWGSIIMATVGEAVRLASLDTHMQLVTTTNRETCMTATVHESDAPPSVAMPSLCKGRAAKPLAYTVDLALWTTWYSFAIFCSVVVGIAILPSFMGTGLSNERFPRPHLRTSYMSL